MLTFSFPPAVLRLIPCTIRTAKEFVTRHHRHHKAPQGALFAVAAGYEGRIAGVAIVGRPVARMLQDGRTAEVIRLATDGAPNACSMLYGAARRACAALGYTRLITYILGAESGVSLRAAGWVCEGAAGGGSWGRESRARRDDHPLTRKVRYEARIGGQK